MKKIAAFTKNNYHYFVFFLFLLITFIISLFVDIRMLDDIIYYTVGKAGIKNIISFLKWHYCNQNARLFVHFVEMITLSFNLNVWRVLNALTMGLLAYTTAKNIENEKVNFKTALIGSSLFYTSIDFNFLRPTLYWISASFNYILPLTIISLFIYVYKRKPKSALLPVLTFFAAISMEQASAIMFGLIVLLCAKSIIEDKKISNISLLISLAASLAGILIFVFAPATSSRYGLAKSNLSFVKGFLDSLYNIQIMENWFSKRSLILVTFISVSTVFLLIRIQKSKGTFKGIYSLLSAALLVLTAANIVNDLILPLGVIKLLFMAVLFASLALVSVVLIVKEKQWLPLISLVLGCGSQLMMAFINLHISRTAFPAAICFSYYVIYALTLMYKSVKKPLRAVMIIAAIALSVYNLYGAVPAVQSLSEYVHYCDNYSPDSELVEKIMDKGMYDKPLIKEITAEIEASR